MQPGSSKKKREALEDVEDILKPKHRKRNGEQLHELTVQARNHVAQMMSDHARTHALGLIIDGKHVITMTYTSDSSDFSGSILYLFRFDHQGIILSSGLDFILDFPRFLVLLFAMQRLQNHHWGINQNTDCTFGLPWEEIAAALNMEQDKTNITLQVDPIDPNTSFGLNGRATNVFPVTVSDGKPRVRLCWFQARASDLEKNARDHQIDEDEVHNSHQNVVVRTFEGISIKRIKDCLGSYVERPHSDSRTARLLVRHKLRPIVALDEEGFLHAWWQLVLCESTC